MRIIRPPESNIATARQDAKASETQEINSNQKNQDANTKVRPSTPLRPIRRMTFGVKKTDTKSESSVVQEEIKKSGKIGKFSVLSAKQPEDIEEMEPVGNDMEDASTSEPEKNMGPSKTKTKFGDLFSSLEDVPDHAPSDEKKPTLAPVEQTSSEEIKGKVEKVIYQTDDGFKIYSIKLENGKYTTLSINSPTTAKVGQNIIAKGQWGAYKGRQTFKGNLLTIDMPEDPKGILAWFKAGSVHGVGVATALKITNYFKDDVLSAMSDPSLLMKAGIDSRKAEAIAEAWSMNFMQNELVAWLGALKLGEGTITKIIRRYGMAAKQVIENNPWQLADTIDGVGFIKADEIGRNAGHELTSVNRIRSGLKYALKEAVSRNGHTGLTKNELIYEAKLLLKIQRYLIADQVDSIIDEDAISINDITGLISPVGLRMAEEDVAKHIIRVLEGEGLPEAQVKNAIEIAQRELGIRLDPSQIDAAVTALINNVCIITGGPGTGKSTTQKVIVHVLKQFDRKIGLAAPTGRAAKRLSEVTAMEANTCHKMLAFSGEKGGFAFDVDNPFPQDWIIIDEFSMVDTRLAASFIQAIENGSGLTIVGDIDQLPSVGPGKVLRDLIECGYLPVARLTETHRQGADSGIVTAARRINSGFYPVAEQDGEVLKDFDIQDIWGTEEILKRVVSLMTTDLPEKGYDPIKEVQVLAAMRQGDIGISALNDAIKAAVNPAIDDGNSINIKKKDWTKGDRVMHIRNDYVKNVFNGEVGIISKVGNRKKQDSETLEPYIAVDYSGMIAFYNASDISDIEQAWATTVHKSQGCEFPAVIIVTPSDHKFMMNRNLLYTGVTRGKKHCVTVGEKVSIEAAVSKIDNLKRNTSLKEIIKHHFEKKMQMDLQNISDDDSFAPAPGRPRA